MEKCIFDTHCHYLDPAFDEDRDQILAELPEKGVALVTMVGTTLEDSAAGIPLSQKIPYMYTSVGIHPEFAGIQPADYLDQLAALAKGEKVVAIGEIGLDYHYPGYDKAAQLDLFRAQMGLARDLDLPVIIHARDCTQDYLDVLTEFRPKGVVHCFSGSAETAEIVVKLGMYVGFTGILTFKNAKKARRALAAVPQDQFVLETDCPYMAPVPYRGKRCDSTMIPYTAEAAAEVYGLDKETVLRKGLENGKRLYGLA